MVDDSKYIIHISYSCGCDYSFAGGYLDGCDLCKEHDDETMEWNKPTETPSD